MNQSMKRHKSYKSIYLHHVHLHCTRTTSSPRKWLIPILLLFFQYIPPNQTRLQISNILTLFLPFHQTLLLYIFSSIFHNVHSYYILKCWFVENYISNYNWKLKEKIFFLLKRESVKRWSIFEIILYHIHCKLYRIIIINYHIIKKYI